MSHSSQFLRLSHRRLTAMLLIIAMALVALFAFHGSEARAEIEPELNPLAGCISERFCSWTGTFYTGEEMNTGCGASVGTTFELRSAKNRCSWNIRIGWNEGGVTNWKACLGPGGERPEPGRFNEIVPFAC